MPKLWDDTIEAHHDAVSAAIFEATSLLVAEHGLAALSMAGIAQAAGIGRATLYKYFGDLDALLSAWHQHVVHGHLQVLADVRDAAGSPGDRLATVLAAYVEIQRAHGAHASAAQLHGEPHMRHAHGHLHRFIRDLIANAAAHRAARTDIAADELARFAIAAAAAAAGQGKPAASRLVELILATLARR
jgi:AcrR family transcriptional regulator